MSTTPTAKDWTLVLGLPLASLAELAKAFAPGETGDRHRLASARIPPFLVLDLAAQAIGLARNEA